MSIARNCFAVSAALAASLAATAHAENADPLTLATEQEQRTERVAQQLWDWAEVGYLEMRSSGLLIQELESEGFAI